jgi:hypothetical protein
MLRGSASGLVQCLVSSRSTRPVQVRASCRRYAFRAALRMPLASCVRSDARRRQSRSSLSICSDFDIAHRLELSRASVARCRVSCRWPTPHMKAKKRLHEDPATCGGVEYACKEIPATAGFFREISTSSSPFRRPGGSGAIQPGSTQPRGRLTRPRSTAPSHLLTPC